MLHGWPFNKVYFRCKFATNEHQLLKLAIVEDCKKLSQRFISKSISQVRRRLEKLKTVENQGGHIEFEL